MRRLEPSQRDKARGSGGPRSEKGKQQSARNALKHGLAVPVSRDPNLTPEVVRLARKICGQRDDLLDTAIEVAEAQIDLARVRRLRTERINGALQEPLRKSGTELRREIAFLGRLLRATKTGRLSSVDQVRLRKMKDPESRALLNATPGC